MAERTGPQNSTGSGNKSTSSSQNRTTGSGSNSATGSSMKSSTDSGVSTPGVSHSSEMTGSAKSSGSTDNLEGVLGLLQKLGMDEQHWRAYVSDTITNKVQDVDFRDVMERAKEYASMSGDKLKDLSTKNPRMFYSGLAAFILGAGMMASAARTSGDSVSGETLTVGDDSRPIT